MGVITSPFPPVAAYKVQNVHSFIFDNKPATDIPLEHILYINGLTGQQRTYGEFLERVRDAATGIAADISVGGFGIQPRCDPPEIIGILSPNSMEYIVLMHACLRLTVPIALLPAHPTPTELVYLLRRSCATRLFVHPTTLQLALSVAQEINFPIEKIYLLEGHDTRGTDLEAIIRNVHANKIPRRALEPADRDTLAYLVFSSGTSGLPKAVMISHGNIIYATLQYLIGVQEVMKIIPKRPAGPAPRHLCSLPFYHTYGLHVAMFRSFVQPNTYVILPRWNTEHVLTAIASQQINVIGLVPSQIHQLVHHPKTPHTDTSSITALASGGAYLTPDLEAKMRKTFTSKAHTRPKDLPETEFAQGYGMSEGTISSLLVPRKGLLGGKLPDTPGSTGILVPSQDARIVLEDGRDAGINEPGELWLRGGNIALGYWQDEKATKETFLPGGWLRTGDRFRVDENGFFFFEDRLKDTLKVSGAQVSPAELENTLLEHPENLVIDVAVAGVLPHYATSENEERVPRAWVVLSGYGHALGRDEVIKKLESWSRQRLSKFKWLRGGIGIVEAIPKNPTGKVLRRVLRDEHERVLAKKIKAKAKAKL